MINLGIFVCSFDVCRVSYPVPSINYVLGYTDIVKVEIINILVLMNLITLRSLLLFSIIIYPSF